jgi:LysR family glycine cleavage system transcriptional activator
MQGQLPLNALRAFEVAARHKSFSKAAEELHVTPAAISQQIKTLEDYIGTPLFHRLSRGIALTKAAESALPALNEGFSGVAEGMHRLRSGTDENRLDVWMAPSFASKWLMPRLNRFTAKHPEIDLRITASGDLIDQDSTVIQSQAKHFHHKGVDIAIRFGDGHYDGCNVETLMPACVVPLCSPGLVPNIQQSRRQPEEILQHTLLHDETDYEGRPTWSDWLHKAGVKHDKPDSGLHFNHVSLALEAACDGQGVVLSLEQLARTDIERGRLVIPFDLRIKLESAYHIISLTNPDQNPGVNAFKQWLLDEAANLDDNKHVISREA